MNALIYADEYRRLEQQLDVIQLRLAVRGFREYSSRACSTALDAERGDVIRRLMHLDDLIAFDGDFVS